MNQSRWPRVMVMVIAILGLSVGGVLPAWARIDAYVNQYLQVSGPIELRYDTDAMLTVEPSQLEHGKALFQEACINCHVGGVTLPDPSVSLSLEDLQGAEPPRNTVLALMEFQRDPLNYDSTAPSFGCRRVTPAWLKDDDLQDLAAFILRAAEVAPGWGTAQLVGE